MILQMGPPPNPEDMINLLQNPQFASTLDEALSNPQYIDMMIQSNPMLRGMGPQVRAILQNPEYRRMIMDPQVMRQMHQMQQQYGGGMFGGMGGMGGGAGGEGAFPAPGATDQTPEGAARTDGEGGQQQQQGQDRQQPINPFGMFGGNPFAMMGNPGMAGVAGGQQAANPFAALFRPQNPATTPPANNSNNNNNPPTTDNNSTTTPEAARENPSQTPNLSQQQQQDANTPQNNPFALLQAIMGGMNPNANPSNPSDPNAQQQPPNPMAMLQNPIFQEAMNAYMRAGGPGGAGNNNNNNNPFGGGLPSMMNNPFFDMGPGGMFGAEGRGQPSEPADTRPPEERYAEQLRQLNDMGFFEFERNVAALRRSGGNVQGAVEFLLS